MTEEKKLEKGNVRFASGKKFVQSMRYQGLTDEDAIKEFIDNSFDADAENIWIEIWEEENCLSISIQDDGNGMSAKLLEKSLAFGETNNEDYGNKIGRFGFGMPTAITSKTKYADVFSKIEKEDYSFTQVNLDELENDPTLSLYKPESRNPKKNYKHIKDVNSGTIIILNKCDRLDFKKTDTIRDHLIEELGMTYRYFILEGKNIFINNIKVEVDDPLMILKEHKYRDLLLEGLKKSDIIDDRGYSETYDIDPVPIEYKNSNNEKKTGYVRIKLVLLPIKDIWRTAGTTEKKWKKYRISVETCGFYVMRNNRQIAGGKWLNLPSLKAHPMFTYFRAEIDFDSVLDDQFGVQVNKTRFFPSRSVRKKISDAVKAVANTIRRKQYDITHELSAKDEEEKKIAEEIAKEAAYKQTKKAKKATEEDIEKATKNEIKQIEADKDLSDEAKNEKAKNIREILEKQMPFILDTNSSRQGPIYTWEYLGKTTKILLNREHPFYKYFWVPTKMNTYIRTMLKIMIFTLVKGEQIQEEELQEGSTITYQELHNHWNMILRKYLTSDKFLSFVDEEMPETEGYEDIEISD